VQNSLSSSLSFYLSLTRGILRVTGWFKRSAFTATKPSTGTKSRTATTVAECSSVGKRGLRWGDWVTPPTRRRASSSTAPGVSGGISDGGEPPQGGPAPRSPAVYVDDPYADLCAACIDFNDSINVYMSPEMWDAWEAVRALLAE
jgi:hypothetical protein